MNLRHFVPSLAILLTLAAAALAAAAVPPDAYSGLRWRLAGPLRGGWGTCASGVPGQPETFYFGAADGGVWKTTDAGRTWNPLFEHEKAASIGALAVAPSDPSVLYVGTGQVTSRWDIASGSGIYRSGDGGRTWEARGLADSRHIGRLWVDPNNVDVVLAAVQGHLFGPHPERGVFRSTDGGRSWEKVLFVDENTGAVDLAADPAAPGTVYAATWQVRYYPWLSYFTPTVGPGSGIHKSTDGGRTWTHLTGHGLPAGPLGRIGLAVAPGSRGARVYATVNANGPDSGLYRSDDAGATWQRVSSTASFASDYFSMIAVDPKNPDTLYVMGQSIRRSTDGGKTFAFFRGAPGGDDYHYLWIDPDRPERMIVASDQGTVVTVNGGASWGTWYNQPTGQFYHVATDDRFPYWIYSGQQDSGTVAVASRSDYGQLTFRDWHPVGGDERDYDLPFPGDPDIVYGSGLGGRLSRWDGRTGQVANVAPWPISSYGQRPTSVRYRSTWITPIAISALPPHAIYLGAQVLFRSTDGGQHWQTVSPDLSGAVPGATGCEGDVPVERARVCGYGVISTIAPSPIEKDLVWVGTDDGLIRLTRDGGQHWQNVTPPGLAEWSRLAQIDASPASAGTAYAAVDRHRLDDLRPYIYITHDFGRTWRAATAGLPADAWVGVVRQDPVKADLLFAGTSRGAFVSFDGGGNWQPLQLNLPTTGINDLTIHGDDLIAATEGRSLWVLDDVTPLRHLGAGAVTGATLFPPATAYRVGANQNRDTPLPLDEPRTLNPPAGAILDYVLPAAPGAVTLEVVDDKGKVVRSFSSGEAPKRPEGGQYFADAWLQPPTALPARPGHNRFVWDLRGPRPRALEYEYSIAAVPGADTPELPQGLFVLPGTYQVRLTAGGKAVSQPLKVAMDPRVKTPPADLAAQHQMYAEVAQALARVTDAQEQTQAIADRLKTLDTELAGRPDAGPLREQAKRIAADLGRFQSAPGTGRRGARGEDNLAAVAAVLTPLATDLEGADRAPTGPQREVFEIYRKRLDATLAKWQALLNGEIRGLDRQVRAAGLAPVAR